MPRAIKLFVAQGAIWLGIGAAISGAALFTVVSAYPLRIVSPYPTPPDTAISGPFGRTKEIPSVTLYRNHAEQKDAYFERLTTAVASGIVHYWHAGDKWEASDARFTRVSPWDNYLLWAHAFHPRYAHFNAYEFISPEKAIARGYGFCSQVSRVVYSILTDQGIPARVLGNAQHVIVEAEGSILDSDYGVFIPHSAEWMQQHPEAVKEYYAAFDRMIPLLTQIYTEGWYQVGNPEIFAYMRGYEAKMDGLKWIPPILLMAGGIVGYFIGASLMSKVPPFPRYRRPVSND